MFWWALDIQRIVSPRHLNLDQSSFEGRSLNDMRIPQYVSMRWVSFHIVSTHSCSRLSQQPQSQRDSIKIYNIARQSCSEYRGRESIPMFIGPFWWSIVLSDPFRRCDTLCTLLNRHLWAFIFDHLEGWCKGSPCHLRARPTHTIRADWSSVARSLQSSHGQRVDISTWVSSSRSKIPTPMLCQFLCLPFVVMLRVMNICLPPSLRPSLETVAPSVGVQIRRPLPDLGIQRYDLWANFRTWSVL